MLESPQTPNPAPEEDPIARIDPLPVPEEDLGPIQGCSKRPRGRPRKEWAFGSTGGKELLEKMSEEYFQKYNMLTLIGLSKRIRAKVRKRRDLTSAEIQHLYKAVSFRFPGSFGMRATAHELSQDEKLEKLARAKRAREAEHMGEDIA